MHLDLSVNCDAPKVQIESLAWWGPARIVLYGRDAWEVRSWPEGALVDAGAGLAVPGPDGERWAVATSDEVEIDGVRHPLPDSIQARSGCWWRGGVCVVRTDPRGGGTLSEIWWVTAAQGSVRLLTAVQGSRFFSVAAMGDALFAKLYTDGNSCTTHTMRILSVHGVEDAADATPDLLGSVHQVITMSERRQVVLWSEDPILSQQVLIRGEHQGEAFTPELRVAGLGQRIDDRQLLLPVYDGIRIGMSVLHIDDASWRWALRDPAASIFPFAVDAGGEVAALRRPVEGSPTLVSVRDGATHDVVALDQSTPSARVHRWNGPTGPLEGLMVTPPGPGPWPLVVDVHGGPNHELVAGFEHELQRWRRAGFAALAPEYAAAGIGGSRRRSAAWMNSGPPHTDPNVEDVASAITAPGTAALASEVFLFGWSWGGFVVNRMVTTGIAYRAAACWEGSADHRLMDVRAGGEPFRRARWGNPIDHREIWERASPVTRAGAVRTPMLLLYGEDGCREQGEAWYSALSDAGVPVELWIYPGGHLPAPDVVDEIYLRAAAWFRFWAEPPVSLLSPGR